MTKFFCCCIPVRFGVFVISLLSLVFSAFCAFVVWWTLTHQGDANIVHLESSVKPAFIAEGVHYSLLAIASLVGLVGALGRKRGLVSFYSSFLWGSLIVNAVLGIWSIVKVLQTFDDSVKDCKSDLKDDLKNTLNNTLNGNFTTVTNGNGHNDCISGPAAKAIYVSVFSVSLILMLWGTIIVYRYKHQLNDEERWDTKHNVEAQSGKKAFFSSAPTPEAHPLSAAHYDQGQDYSVGTPYHPVATGDYSSYPYVAPQHSHGRSTSG